MQTAEPSVLHTPIGSVKEFRVTSIDLLRGIVMIIMALDHIRDYFHTDAFIYDPLDLSKTNVVLFFTRWITHFCAPVFVFLAGTSAFLSGQKKTKKELSLFLLKRGFWLIFLELTIFNFGWTFNISFPIFPLAVIWVLGTGMLVLSALVHLRWQYILIFSIVLIVFHNLLDSVRTQGTGAEVIGWSFLHQPGLFKLGSQFLLIGYPIIPWVGLMALGYSFGRLYSPDFEPAKRKRILITTGISAIILFLVLRSTNSYGDRSPWSIQANPVFTALSYLNTTKYPPSLLFLLMTIGPALLFLAFTEKSLNRVTKVIATYGRVPLFYYVVHIYLLHLLAMLAAELSGHDWSDMIIKLWVNLEPQLKDYGFGLGVVYAVWIVVVIILYPICRWYDKYKTRNKERWWLSYL